MEEVAVAGVAEGVADGVAEDVGGSTGTQVRPVIPFSKTVFGPLFDPAKPVIERLAKVAEKKKEQPVAGWYGIQHVREPEANVPPESLLYEQDHYKFQLGKVPKYRDFPHQELPKGVEEWKPPTFPNHVFTPLWKVPPREKTDLEEQVERAMAEAEVQAQRQRELDAANAKLVAEKMKELGMDEMANVRELAKDQEKVTELKAHGHVAAHGAKGAKGAASLGFGVDVHGKQSTAPLKKSKEKAASKGALSKLKDKVSPRNTTQKK